MSRKELKTRSPISNAVDNDLLKRFKQLSSDTKIPQSKLLDEAIELVLKKYAESTK